MDLLALRPVLDQQSGIVSRRQLVEAGGTQSDLRRWLRAHDLVEVHKGVYVNHTGPLTWSSRAWAAVQRLEDAVLWSCSELGRAAALERVSESCRSRRTTPLRLRDELARHPNLRDRAWLAGVLDDAADGVQSVLESTYLRRVERAHGLPRGERQLRRLTVQGMVYRDVRYRPFGLLVELDGRLGHEGFAARASDMTRDLLAAAAGAQLTLRLGWHQSEVEPCLTASALGTALRQRGWSGRPPPCGAACRVGARGTEQFEDAR